MYWNDGSLYKGSWSDGKQEGEGILYLADGRVKQGYFENDKLVKALKQQQQISDEYVMA